MEQKACEKCGCGGGYEEDNPLCSLVEMAFCAVGWLCLSCRREWLDVLRDNKIAKAYRETMFRLECFRARLEATGEGNVDDGLALWNKAEEHEAELSKVAADWLKSGE